MKTKKLLTLIAFTLLAIIITGKAYAQDTPPAGTPVIELTTTTAGATVRINMAAATDNTPVWIETAPNIYTPVKVGINWTDYTNYTPTGTSLKIYGAIIAFSCNGESTTNINPVSALDASGNTKLGYLYCSYNQLTSLNTSGLTKLEWLNCSYNQLTSLNTSGLTNLEWLKCSYNQLTNLNVQGLTKLKELWCYGNPYTSTTLGLDLIYCHLPARQQSEDARIYVSEQTQNNIEAFVLATNGEIANNKYWGVYGYNNNVFYKITNTTGTYDCSAISYPLWVAGIQVTSANFSAITGSGITGSVSYDDATKTLTLNNATITGVKETRYSSPNSISQSSIKTTMSLLKINLIGTNSIAINLNTISGYDRYSATGIITNSLYFIGNGSLNIDVSVTGNGSTTYSAYSYGIEAATYLSEPADLFISKDVSLEVSTKATGATNTGKYAITCDTEVSPNIENESQRVIKEGNDAASAMQIPSLTMWDNTSTNQSKPYVKISNIDTGLSTLTAEGIYVWGEKGVISINTPYLLKGNTSERTAHIYNVSGMLVRTLSLQGTEGQVTVPAGIYIVRIGNAIEKVVVR